MNCFATSWKPYWLALLLGASVVGCSGKDTVGVTGKVTFDGLPVEKGEVSFIPADGQGAPAGGVIENGSFAFEANPAPSASRFARRAPCRPNGRRIPTWG